MLAVAYGIYSEVCETTFLDIMAPQNLRVAILQNFMIEETGGRPMIERISQLILLSKPHAEITVYAPIQGDAFPKPDAQDLIILTGGPYDLMGGNNPRWVDDTLDFIKAIATSCSKPKVLGICWGQQAIALSLKGTLGKSKRGHCVCTNFGFLANIKLILDSGWS